MFQPKAVANRFLELAHADGESVSPMKMQKLVYFAHGWMLGVRDRDLINEPIEAWRFGPVIRSLYREFADYGNAPISRPVYDYRLAQGGEWSVYAPSVGSGENYESADAHALTQRIWEVFGGYSAFQLSNMTHNPGPWSQVNDKYNGQIPDGEIIPRDSIRDYFRSLIKQ